MKFPLKLGVSARHIHLCEADWKTLFGNEAELHVKKYIGQPGQFAAEEQVTLATPKGAMKVRVIGPLREETQAEISMTEARSIGLTPPIRLSGHTEGSPGGTIIGPKGEVVMNKGIIVAARHIHLCPETAAKYELKQGDVVSVHTMGMRSVVFENVMIRTGANHADEFHIDTDEGNCCGLFNGVDVEVFK